MNHIEKNSPDLGSPEFHHWYVIDQSLLSWINATLSLSALPYTIGVKHAKDAWEKLSLRFGQISIAQTLSLRKQLHDIRKGSQTMASYLQQFKTLTDQLAASHSPISDDDLLISILNGLPSKYRPFASSINARFVTITTEELHSLLVAEEICLQDESSLEHVIALAAQHQ